MLQGSVAREEEREDSDLDVTVVRPDGVVPRLNEVLSAENHGPMTRIRVQGVDVDVNWLFASELLERVRTRGAVDWFMFHEGVPVHDPEGLAARCQAAIREWFAARPEILAAWRRQQAAVERRKRDPSAPLAFATQPEFCAHLAGRLREG